VCARERRGVPFAGLLHLWLRSSLRGLAAELDAALSGIRLEVRVQVARQRLQAIVRSFGQILRTLEQRPRLIIFWPQRERPSQRLLCAQRIAALEQHLTQVPIRGLQAGRDLHRLQERSLRADQVALEQMCACLEQEQRRILAILRLCKRGHAARVGIPTCLDQILRQRISVF